ncbi:unnamed protein product [Brassicogethes aeneus]|uniref:Glutathione synthetase n=1 Tax=Brassicogethes aeneus TaxID=1431903 RepID=A0A9P0FEL2_BRAAE|nr:unnamed protein product [Brassicogethes aeneus]
MEWGLSDTVQALCCGTTASNTGRISGACVLLKQMLGKDLLYLLYRHHIYELVLRGVFEARIPHVTSSPDIPLFKNFKKNWCSLYHSSFKNGIENPECCAGLEDLPDNNALQGLCQGLIDAWKIYGKLEAVILFVVEDITYNICDQRFHEFEIRNLNPEVKVIRRSLTQIADKGSLSSENELIVDGYMVAVIYFRAGYEPGHYHGNKEWDARLLMERSLAIKCPSIHYHLAGTKKIQQALAKPGCLEKFLIDEKHINDVKQIFTGLYALDFNKLGDQAIQMALNDPERDSQKILVNRQVGHMLRTKLSTSNEGGVAAGAGALDSPYLVE